MMGFMALGKTRTFSSLTPRMALNLAAPHTWPAAIMPTLAAMSAASVAGPVSISLCIALLAIVILMQSAVNTFNDYYDFIKGTDSDDDYVDPSDAVLVYNNVNPRSALVLAIGFLAGAFLLGVYAIAVAGFAPLAIALVGAVFVVSYSAGKSPVSYLPVGELVSGVVMGGLIPLAVYQVLTLSLDFTVLAWSVPTIIGVGLIMFTNNTCDIERDVPAGRRTLPVLLGRRRSVTMYRVLLVVWVSAIVAIVGIWFTPGLIVVPFMLLASYPLLKALFGNTFTPERRLQAMPAILNANIALGAFYAASIMASSSTLAI